MLNMPHVKKLLLIALMACAMALLAFVGTAAADGGPHGGYTPTADGCAGCHRTHTAKAPQLLTAPIGQLCLTCHAGQGATTNVMAGVLLDAPGGAVAGSLKAGGFTSAVMSTDFGAAASRGVTSMHTYDGSLGTIWGNGALNATANPGLAGFALTCTNCHDPHGNGQYRILRPIPTGSGALVNASVPDVSVKNYAINPSGTFRVLGQYFGEGYKPDCSTDPAENPTSKTNCEFGDPASLARRTSSTGAGLMTPQYIGLTPWCSACHTRYSAPSAAGATDSGDAIFKFRHLSNTSASGCSRCHNPNVTGTSYNGTRGSAGGNVKADYPYGEGEFRHELQCMSCHVSHGTAAQMGPYSGISVLMPDGSAVSAHNDRSSLLRLDGRGTCQSCHDKGGSIAPGP